MRKQVLWPIVVGLGIVLGLAAPARAASVRGDFNGDGFTDLAIGVPDQEVGVGDGAVIVLYGSASGLTAAGSQLWTQDSPGVPGTASWSAKFGGALATGDFNGDGFSDLAIGAYEESVNGVARAGAVNVLYGSASGLTSGGSQYWTQDSPGVPGTADDTDEFGHELAAGDFNADGRDDLAIAVPGESLNGIYAVGGVNILYGSASGLTSAGSQFWSQDSPGIPGTAQSGDHFGWSLAAGDFDGDGKADLAIGVPDESVNGVSEAGGVNVLYGSASGLNSAGSQFWSQDSPGVAGVAGVNDTFGWAVAAGDFNGDGRADLAIGVPSESFNGVGGAGAVNVLRGSLWGLTATGNQLWTQDSPGVPGTLGYHVFGLALGGS